MSTARPATLVAAAVACTLNALSNLATIGSPIPKVIIVLSAALAVVAVVGLVGLWRLRRWGAVVSGLVLAATVVLAAPGVTSAPMPLLTVVALVTIVVDLAGIALLVLPVTRRVYA